MITEDYVSFETAKLLKEKEFDWNCITYYVDYEPNDVKYSMLFENNTTWEERCYSAPTLQMVMAWLREVHNIFIVIEPYTYNYVDEKISSYVASLWQDDNCCENITSKNYPTYEETVEAAVKYVLENLI